MPRLAALLIRFRITQSLRSKREIVGNRVAPGDKELPNNRFRGPGGETEGGVIGRHCSPTQYLLAFFLDDLFK